MSEETAEPPVVPSSAVLLVGGSSAQDAEPPEFKPLDSARKPPTTTTSPRRDADDRGRDGVSVHLRFDEDEAAESGSSAPGRAAAEVVEEEQEVHAQ